MFLLRKDKKPVVPGEGSPFLDFIKKHPDALTQGDWIIHLQDVPFHAKAIQFSMVSNPVTDNPQYDDFPGWGKIIRVFRNLPLKDNLKTIALPDSGTPAQCRRVQELVGSTHPGVDVVRFRAKDY